MSARDPLKADTSARHAALRAVTGAAGDRAGQPDRRRAFDQTPQPPAQRDYRHLPRELRSRAPFHAPREDTPRMTTEIAQRRMADRRTQARERTK